MKPLSHWENPRDTIACAHKDSDFAYALHGAQMAALVIRALDRRPSELQTMTCLDYGCGTGRISRVLASHFQHVHAYDPQPACMAEAAKECPEIPITNLTIGVIPHTADVAVCINVIEHLNEQDADNAMSVMLTAAPIAVVWYHAQNNAATVARFKGQPVPWQRNKQTGIIVGVFARDTGHSPKVRP